MISKKTLDLIDYHHRFLDEKVDEGIFASPSKVVAAALDQMIQDEKEREAALDAVAEEIRVRMKTPRSDYVDADDAFAAARAHLKAAGNV